MEVTSLMRRAAAAFADSEAVTHEARSLMFAEAWERGCRLANALIAMGLEPGDRVAVLEDNCLEASDCFLALSIANLVRVPLYARGSCEGHLHMMTNTACKAVIVAEDYADDIRAVQPNLPDLAHVLVRDAGYNDWLMTQSPVDPMVDIKPDDYYIIRHTGGTTGKPKAVAYTHWTWLATARDWFYNHPPVVPGDACLHIAPISHASGYFFIPIWLSGGRNVMVDKFDPLATINVIERERIAYLLVVPTILSVLNQDPTAHGRDWSALKCLVVTSAPIADATALKAREIFGDVLYQGYGQTEAVAVAYMGPKEWFAEVEGSTPLRACGRVSPYAMLEIWDEENNPVPFGTPGQIAARMDGQMVGYWNNPEATAERLINGWVLTGDIGILDRNGYLYLLDRADDMIVSGGYNIWPLELENAISFHPAVLEVAVFGVPHEKWGETPLATIVLKPFTVATEEEIIALCVERLGSFKKPGKVVFRDEPLPKSAVGKLRRKDLREAYWVGHSRRVGGS